MEDKPIRVSVFETIDVLRGIASLSVVIYHSRVDLWVGWNQIQKNPTEFSNLEKYIAFLSIPMPFMGTSVMLFFILSGYCIHYANKQNIEFKYLLWYKRRFFRIYIPYLAIITFCFFIENILSKYFLRDISSPNLLLRTILMTQNYFKEGQLVSNPSLWSLPVEMEFYLLYPFIYTILLKNKWRKILVIIAGLSISSISIYFMTNSEINVLSLNYLLIWYLGAYLASTNGKLNLSNQMVILLTVISFIVGIVSILLKLPSLISDYIWAFFYFFFFSLLIKDNLILKKLNIDIIYGLKWLGKISFSLYLIHFPIFKLMGNLYLYYFNHKPYNLLVALLATILVIPLAYIFYILIEKPAHLYAKRFARKDNLK